MEHSLSEQEKVRREALEALRSKGINPYPAEGFEVNVSAKGIKKNYDANKLDYLLQLGFGWEW